MPPKKCSLVDCTAGATQQCRVCARPFCSVEHRDRDWIVSTHPLDCAVARIRDGLGDASTLNLQKQPRITPAWISSMVNLEYIANGMFGVVFKATDFNNGTVRVLKVFSNKSASDLAREAHVSMLLSTLYVDNGDPTHTIAPVIISYDYGVSTWSKVQLSNFLSQYIPPHILRVNKESLKNFILHDDALLMRSIKTQVGFMLMEMVPGRSLFETLKSLDAESYVAVLPELLLQILLILADLQRALEFVHYDLHPDNVIVQKLDAPVVLCYTLQNGVSYNIKTRYVVRILDFGISRLQWKDVVYYAPNPGYKFGSSPAPTHLDKYRPWNDCMTLAATLIFSTVDDVIYQELLRKLPVVALLQSMIGPSDSAADPSTNAAEGVRRAFKRIFGLLAKDGSDDLFAQLHEQCKQMIGTIYDYSPGAKGFSARDVVLGSDLLFEKHKKYVASGDDRVYDMNLQIGHKSGATVVAASDAMAAGSSLFGWMSSLVNGFTRPR